MANSNYEKDVLKQIAELMKKCDGLSHEMKVMKQNHKEEVKILKEEIRKKDEKIRSLENEVDRLKKIINNDSSNSSNPPSSDNKPNKKIENNRQKSGKKQGGQLGHKPYILAKKYVEDKIETGEFKHQVVNHGIVRKDYKSKYILDVEINVIAEEHRFYSDKNGKYNIPVEFISDVQYGANIKTLCIALNANCCVAINKVADFVKNITNGNLTPSIGSVMKFVEECSKKLESNLEKIKENLLNASLMYTDATVSRCESKNESVRNYSTKTETLLIGTRGKSKKHINEVGILPQYTGNLVHDHETVMYNYGNKHGECNVHILRYLKGNTENTKHKWSKYLGSLLCSLNNTKKAIVKNGNNSFARLQLERISKRYDEIIEYGYEENKKLKSKYYKSEEKRLLNRLKKYKENHLLFIYDFSIPFDNNQSERDLRHVKSKLKMSGCFRSEKGMQWYLNIRSIISTCTKKALNSYEILTNIYKNIPVEI